MAAMILPYKGIMPKIHETAFIAENAVIIGDVEIGAGSGVWYGCVLRGDVNVIRVGENSNIQDGTVVHVSSTTQGTYIGNNITIGHMALLHACTLEDGCFIGMKACVMDDATVASGAMVGAGAMVTPRKQVPSGQLWLGSPARYARDLSEQERAYLIESPAHYARLAQTYRAQQVS
ncbi:MAG TPA: gamma carbonic anhydrase family protein [Rhodospirillaceae bacterium]|nr:gamma carbonic anhydrase family protein [Alphaproteobacteria bacterium]OUT42200.1 MAG: gamma carbonic anhydrase family protein [Micavibrio sp. TMED2]HCI45686.1 gamma carbonic anhydrase family protein [Rhodospirillaceae bacterium]MAS46181.1 gamma carbonic anhydrase family protein [Alphaproteobacteria bacterium]MAX95636.1 gamma carbonic anhydrase family protein [Alphaproteobacteria bacterium]|tara:strand:+ start:651 stop:1178 length:528 start_codon:yes stop_codon:yes gene_type:complete